MTKNDVERKSKSVPGWIGAGSDKIQGFQLKFFTTVNEVLATFFNECREVVDVSG